ncbi:MAG: hypothetical protein ACOH5I_10755 [Oligoflexus sp.]
MPVIVNSKKHKTVKKSFCKRTFMTSPLLIFLLQCTTTPPLAVDQQRASTPRLPNTAANRIESNLGAVEIQADGPLNIEHQLECPRDESYHYNQFEVNTFEVGIQWNVRGNDPKPRAYSRYRCIPR